MKPKLAYRDCQVLFHFLLSRREELMWKEEKRMSWEERVFQMWLCLVGVPIALSILGFSRLS